MSATLLGFILDVIGKVMVAYTAIAVHRHFFKEHKIDETVFNAMKREQVIGVVGIILIVIGFFLQLPTKL